MLYEVITNTSFYFNPDSPLARARDANQISSLLAVEKIAAEDEKTGEILIEADKLFLTQSLVITSYSIHYTKLYEASVLKRAISAAALGCSVA